MSHFVGWHGACNTPGLDKTRILIANKHRSAFEWDYHIQNYYYGRYIVIYMGGNHVLGLRIWVTVKLNFRPYIWWNTSLRQFFWAPKTLVQTDTWENNHNFTLKMFTNTHTVNLEIFAWVLFSRNFTYSRNFAYAKFGENKILAKCQNHSVVYWSR